MFQTSSGTRQAGQVMLTKALWPSEAGEMGDAVAVRGGVAVGAAVGVAVVEEEEEEEEESSTGDCASASAGGSSTEEEVSEVRYSAAAPEGEEDGSPAGEPTFWRFAVGCDADIVGSAAQ